MKKSIRNVLIGQYLIPAENHVISLYISSFVLVKCILHLLKPVTTDQQKLPSLPITQEIIVFCWVLLFMSVHYVSQLCDGSVYYCYYCCVLRVKMALFVILLLND